MNPFAVAASDISKLELLRKVKDELAYLGYDGDDLRILDNHNVDSDLIAKLLNA